MRRFAFPGSRALPLLTLILCASCASNLPAPAWQLEDEPAPPTPVARLYAFPEGSPAEVTAPAPPLSLTASDGTGLRLLSVEARAVVEEPLAFTELRLTFENPEDRRLEGTFSITLPDGAAISRFSMKIGEDWQEGEVVEKQSARQAYEDFLHRRQDPALLEQAPGNQFTARVFPIPARAKKELVVSYSQELTGGRPYVLPLRGLPELGKLSVSVSLAGQAQVVEQIDRANVTPAGDVRLDPRHLRGGAGLRSGELVLARVRPVPAAEPDPFGPTVLLVDTSASRALGFEEQVRLVGRLARRVAETSGPHTRLLVGAYDQTTDAVFEGEAGSFGDGDLRILRERQAFGASNLEGALGWVEAHARARGYKRVILVGDGVATAGSTEAGALAARARRLEAAGVERLDAVVMGGLRDEAALKKLTTAGLARDGVVADGGLDPAALERRLLLATRSGIPVAVEGARWQWPTVLDGVQAGDEVLVYAEVPEGRPVRLSVGGSASQALDLATVERPLLERAWAKAKIGSLVDRSGEEGPKADVVRQVIALSTAHRVLSPYTSLLVLETDADFARFRLDRKALADILTVDRGRLAVAKRRPPPAPAGSGPADTRLARTDAPVIRRGPAVPLPPPPDPQASAPAAPTGTTPPMAARGSMWGASIGESYGAGGLGLSGVGEGGGGRGEAIGLGRVGSVGHGAGTGSGQGFGSGHGRIVSSHSVRPPQVRMGATQVSGRIPPEIIQRIVRQNFGRIRACYERELLQRPDAQGRIAVQFVIDRDGAVSRATVADPGELGPSVGACIARAMYSLTFPAPENGVVTVVYPFVLTPGDGAPAAGHRTVTIPPMDVTPPSDPPARKRSSADPYTGRFKTVMDLVGAGGARAAIESAYAWHREAPGDVMALVALGEALEGAREKGAAARVYGSIVDLFPARADLRRFAGERLERLGDAGAAEAIDTFLKAEEERPDHPEGHRLVAFAKLRQGDFAGAFAAAVRGNRHPYPSGRFRGVDQILREDLGLVAAAWIKAEPARREEIMAKLADAGGTREDQPSLRFVLSWETDANDVDFHIHDADGGHAFYSQPKLPSGGMLYADVTDGYGPECFTIRKPREERSERYRLEAHYYSRGPMGYGMGKLEIIDHDGKGGLTFEERPFVVMNDGAYVDLGTWTR